MEMETAKSPGVYLRSLGMVLVALILVMFSPAILFDDLLWSSAAQKALAEVAMSVGFLGGIGCYVAGILKRRASL